MQTEIEKTLIAENAKLRAKIEELTAELNNHDYKLGKTVKALQAKVESLEIRIEEMKDHMFQVKGQRHEHEALIQAKIKKLTLGLNGIYKLIPDYTNPEKFVREVRLMAKATLKESE